MIKEFCAENFTDIPRAITHGANRIELCDNLAVGGTTVSYGVLKQTLAYCRPKGIPVMTMLRPRSGDFVYSKTEVAALKEDFLMSLKLGSDGLVFGCLDGQGWLAEDTLLELTALNQGADLTFHMAFDALPLDAQFAAIDWLAAHQFTRILTHGGPAGTDIYANLPHLTELISYSQGKLTLLLGGGITATNYQEISQITGCVEVHGTKIVPLTTKKTGRLL